MRWTTCGGNLLHAEAWLWEEFRSEVQQKVDTEDGSFFIPIVGCLKQRWDTIPGESDREDHSMLQQSGDEESSREYEIRMTTNMPRAQAFAAAQAIPTAHGGQLVVEEPTRDSREPEPESRSSENATLRSDNTTLNSGTTRNTTEDESDRIEQSMAETRACLRREIRVLQGRAARYEELVDQTKLLKEFTERSKSMRQWNRQFEEVQSAHVAAVVNAKW